MRKPVQYFSADYLEQCRRMSREEILEFLENFRLLQRPPRGPSRLISMKVPQPLLDAFRTRCRLEGSPYQTQIKCLMASWLGWE